MSKYGFLEVLNQAFSQGFAYDYEINWDKKNHAVEIFYLLDVANPGVAVTDTENDDEASCEDISFEEAVIFYHPTKSKFKADDYLACFPYDPKKGLSKEFMTYFVAFLQETADTELDALIDFLASEQQVFSGTFDCDKFEKEVAELTETSFYAYPRY